MNQAQANQLLDNVREMIPKELGPLCIVLKTDLGQALVIRSDMNRVAAAVLLRQAADKLDKMHSEGN